MKLDGNTLVIQTIEKADEVSTEPLKLTKDMIYTLEGSILKIQTANRPDTDFILTQQGYYTAGQVIEMHDEEYRNQVPLKVKMRFLEELERRIQKETIDTHVLPEGYVPMAHFLNFGEGTVLYAYAPYHIVYIYYMEMRIAQIQNDTKKLNMMTTLYNDALITFQQEYNRNHKRKPVYTPYYNHARGGY